ncbi:MAG: lycopene cyclase domain-containing protein [Candidatus Paceibacterota bacterium]
MSFEYLIILLILLLTTLFIEKKNHIHLYKSKRERFEIVLFFFIFGILWDTLAISRGHWVFPMEKNINIILGVMPVEEYLFILIVPYFIITIYKLFDSKFRKDVKARL